MGTRGKGANVENMPLGNRSRRKDILQPFRIFYSLGWTLHAAEITGIALSTTSVAVVYAVMVETGMSQTDFGKLILAACFVTDLGTVLALGVLFASFNAWMAVFVAVTALVLWKLQAA